MTNDTAGCFICRKHRGEIAVPGGAVYQDDLVYAGHAFMPDNSQDAYLGYLIVEPKRHVAGLADLADEEAGRIGLVLTRLGRALRTAVAPDHLYLFVMGHHVDHLHYHLVPRYPGAPREYWGVRVNEWPDAPRGDTQAVASVCTKIRAALDSFNH